MIVYLKNSSGDVLTTFSNVIDFSSTMVTVREGKYNRCQGCDTDAGEYFTDSLSDSDIVKLTKRVKESEAKLTAASSQITMLEDCIVELAQTVYA